MDRIICPISTRATVPYGLPHAPRIPVCSLWWTPHVFSHYIPVRVRARARNHSPIGTSAWQHLIYPQNVERVYTDTQVEGIFAGHLCDILVRTDTCGLQCFGRQLLVFVWYKVAAEREFIDRCTFSAKVKNTDLRYVRTNCLVTYRDSKSRTYLWVWHTTIVPWLWIGLIFTIAIATSRAASHCYGVSVSMSVCIRVKTEPSIEKHDGKQVHISSTESLEGKRDWYWHFEYMRVYVGRGVDDVGVVGPPFWMSFVGGLERRWVSHLLSNKLNLWLTCDSHT